MSALSRTHRQPPRSTDGGQRPELCSAFGSGQMVGPSGTNRVLYDDKLVWERDTDNVSPLDTVVGETDPR